MQLAWFKTADLYIGQSLIMFKLNSETTHIFEHAPTMPLDRVLASCNGLIKKGTKLRIVLSSHLCAAIHVQIPAAVVHSNELNALMSASAAQQLGAPSSEFVCAIDQNKKSIAAAIPIYALNAMQAWVLQQGCSIASLQPLWAVATKFSASQNANIKGLVLHEPDGSILMVETNNDEMQTMSWSGHLASDVMQANVQRVLVGFGLAEQNLLSLQFAARPATAMKNPPTQWHNHWSAL